MLRRSSQWNMQVPACGMTMYDSIPDNQSTMLFDIVSLVFDKVNSRERELVSLQPIAHRKPEMRGSAVHRRFPATRMKTSQMPKKTKGLCHHPAHNMKSCEMADSNI